MTSAASWWAWDLAWLEPFRTEFAADRSRCFSEIRWRLHAARCNLRSANYVTRPGDRELHLGYALEHLCVAIWLRNVARSSRAKKEDVMVNLSCPHGHEPNSCTACDRKRWVDRLEADNAQLRARVAELEAASFEAIFRQALTEIADMLKLPGSPQLAVDVPAAVRAMSSRVADLTAGGRNVLEESMAHALRALKAEERVRELETTLNTPHTTDFLEAVRIEAAHQRERWGSAHDAGKADADWFWLIGYLAGKAIRPDLDAEKRLHHIVTTAAACLNWHAHATGANTRMRPGIEPPADSL